MQYTTQRRKSVTRSNRHRITFDTLVTSAEPFVCDECGGLTHGLDRTYCAFCEIARTEARRRECRGRGYISPDAYERNPEYYDHLEQRNRVRIIDNHAGLGMGR